MQDEQRLTTEEAGDQLSVSARTIRSLIASNKLKAVRVGGKLFVEVDELNRFVNELEPVEPDTL